MRPPHRILNRNQVHRLAAEHLQAHLKFKDYKRKTSAQVLWSLLLAAAARITSLSDACQRLRDAPSDETVRQALLATLPDYAVLQRPLNAALAGHLPRALCQHPQRLAIDLTLIPYHGQPFRDLNEIYRGQAKDGTSHFHAYATAYIIRKGQRSTVALTIGIYTARTALLATTWDRSAVSAFGRHQGVSYPQALGNKGLGTGTASDQQVRPTPMQVGTTAARPVPPRSCGENRCVDTDGQAAWRTAGPFWRTIGALRTVQCATARGLPRLRSLFLAHLAH